MSMNAIRAVQRCQKCSLPTIQWQPVAVAATAAAASQPAAHASSAAPDLFKRGLAAGLVLGMGTFTISQATTCDNHNGSEKTSSVLASSSPLSSSHCEPAGRSGRHHQPCNVRIHQMRSVREHGLNEKYAVDWKTLLGEGSYGSVHPAHLAATGEKVALKKISRSYTDSTAFEHETGALLRIFDNGGHPNICGMHDMYEDDNSFYLIVDLVMGGQLFEHVVHDGAYSEADAARLMHEIASALTFLHGIGVIHSDLKPENLLLSAKNRSEGIIKMIDFGCAVVNNHGDLADGKDHKKDKKRQSSEVETKNASSQGTTAYWPQERFESGVTVTPAMDMWSVGVVLYIMLTGVHPFDIHGVLTDEQVEKKIKQNPCPPLKEELVGHLSKSAIDLILKLMHADPSKRMTAHQMLQHPWVRGETDLKENIRDSEDRPTLAIPTPCMPKLTAPVLWDFDQRGGTMFNHGKSCL